MDTDDHLRHHDEQLMLLTSLLHRQQDLQAQMLTVQATLATRQDDHAARMDEHAQRMARLEEISARVQLTLDAVLAMLRHRNGH